jgi:hypothetical protein
MLGAGRGLMKAAATSKLTARSMISGVQHPGIAELHSAFAAQPGNLRGGTPSKRRFGQPLSLFLRHPIRWPAPSDPLAL